MSRTAPALPVPDRDSREWWEALARHELRIQRCRDCGAARWPPRALCNRCGSLECTWERASGRGRVASWIVNHHPFGSGLPSPYVVLLVRLEEQDDILLPGAYAGPSDGTGLAIDLRVTAEFDDVRVPEGHAPCTLLRWRPDSR
jgi:hypothetical protein